MYEIKISLDNVSYNTKPEKQEIAGISNRIANSKHSLDTTNIKSSIENIGQHGITFAPATFKNGIRKVEAFEQMQFLALDFDNGTTLSEVKNRAKRFDLPILFAYETLSSTNQNKFRVAFLNNTPINDVKLAEISQHALMEIYPEADKSCKDISRMYFGGKKLLYFDESLPTVNTELLLRNMTFYMKKRRGANHYKTHIRKFANKHGIKLTQKGLLDIVPLETPDESKLQAQPEKAGVSESCKNGKKSPKSFIVYNDTDNRIGEFFPNSPINHKKYFKINLTDDCTENTVPRQTNKKRNHKDYRGYKLEAIIGKCQLCKEFMSGERRLHHDELFGIATNFIQIETGITAFKNTLLSYPAYYDEAKLEKWDFHIKYFNESSYQPKKCDNYCSYKDTCQHTANILTTTNPKQKTMQRVSGHEEYYCDVDEAHEDLRQKLIEAIESDDTVWHVIKAQTALGKTHAYLNLAKELDLKFLIVVPTNILKHDVRSRAYELGLHISVSPSLDEIKNELEPHIWEHIKRLRDAGLYSQVYIYINRLAKDGDTTLQEYLEQLREYKNFDGHAITTHRRFLNMSENQLKKYDVIIIDEDIILSSLAADQCTISISTLKKVHSLAVKKMSMGGAEGRYYKALVRKVRDVMQNIKRNNLFNIPSFEWDIDIDSENEEIDGISALTDIPSPGYLLA